MENSKNKKSVKFQGDMLIFCDFIQVFVFTTNHHLKDKGIEKYSFSIISKRNKSLLLDSYMTSESFHQNTFLLHSF